MKTLFAKTIIMKFYGTRNATAIEEIMRPNPFICLTVNMNCRPVADVNVV